MSDSLATLRNSDVCPYFDTIFVILHKTVVGVNLVFEIKVLTIDISNQINAPGDLGLPNSVGLMLDNTLID